MTPFAENKHLSEVCTYGIGGPARYFTEVKTVEQMQEVIKECVKRELPYFVLGKGSNCLFDDRGFSGVVIHNKIDFFETEDGRFHVGAGYSFSLLGSQTARKGWSGLEFASGIPGSVGGAVFMNAGANGKEACESLISVDYVNEEGEVETLKRSELEFSYRFSSFHKMKGAIVGATFELSRSEHAKSDQLAIINYRMNTQPYGEKSAGCIFRNPENGSAGALIEKCGLKGFSVGKAEVSSLHGNFLINKGGASAEEIHSLIEKVRTEVKNKTGITLESEVRVVNYEEI